MKLPVKFITYRFLFHIYLSFRHIWAYVKILSCHVHILLFKSLFSLIIHKNPRNLGHIEKKHISMSKVQHGFYKIPCIFGQRIHGHFLYVQNILNSCQNLSLDLLYMQFIGHIDTIILYMPKFFSIYPLQQAKSLF